MKISYKKIISPMLAFAILFSSFNLNIAYAKDSDDLTGIYLTEEEVKEYSEIDLESTKFNLEEMSDEEKEFYDLLIEKEYNLKKEELEQQGISKEEFYNQVSLYLYAMYNDVNMKATRIISVSALGTALNVVITTSLVATGVGSIGELVKSVGKTATKKWLKNVLAPKIITALTKIGASSLGKWVGAAVVGLVDTVLDPGGYLAKYFDSKDKVPNSGYIELWL